MFERKNCGTKDRVARVVVGALIGAAYLMGYIQGTALVIVPSTSRWESTLGKRRTSHYPDFYPSTPVPS